LDQHHRDINNQNDNLQIVCYYNVVKKLK